MLQQEQWEAVAVEGELYVNGLGQADIQFSSIVSNTAPALTARDGVPF